MDASDTVIHEAHFHAESLLQVIEDVRDLPRFWKVSRHHVELDSVMNVLFSERLNDLLIFSYEDLFAREPEHLLYVSGEPYSSAHYFIAHQLADWARELIYRALGFSEFRNDYDFAGYYGCKLAMRYSEDRGVGGSCWVIPSSNIARIVEDFLNAFDGSWHETAHELADANFRELEASLPGEYARALDRQRASAHAKLAPVSSATKMLHKAEAGRVLADMLFKNPQWCIETPDRELAAAIPTWPRTMRLTAAWAKLHPMRRAKAARGPKFQSLTPTLAGCLESDARPISHPVKIMK